MKLTTKQFASLYQVDPLAAHGLLRCLVALGFAHSELVEKTGKGRREIAYTLDERAVNFLNNRTVSPNV